MFSRVALRHRITVFVQVANVVLPRAADHRLLLVRARVGFRVGVGVRVRVVRRRGCGVAELSRGRP